MPKFQIFNDRQVLEPGSYTQVRGGDKAAPDITATGRVLIIDTGIGAGYGGGAGSLGTKFSGKKAIYSFSNPDDLRSWVGGGTIWDIASRLFKPSKDRNIRGAQEVLILQAKQTAPATAIVKLGVLTAGEPTAGGTLAIKTHNETTGANGATTTSVYGITGLYKGYSVKTVVSGGGLKFLFYRGTYKGLDFQGLNINDESQAVCAAKPKLLVESPVFVNYTAAFNWMKNNSDFNDHFYLDEAASSLAGNGAHGNVSNASTQILFSGATESYTTDALDEAVEVIQEIDHTFFLCDKFGVTDAIGAENSKIFTAATTEGIYQKFLVIGGGKDKSEYAQSSASSFAISKYYDSEYVYVCHSDIYEKKKSGSGFRRLPTFYLAATLVGRLAGASPQTPLTWKDLDVDGVEHDLKLKERENGLKAGVLHLKEMGTQFVINQEINTLQSNDEFVYPNGSSPEGSVMRISSALNKDLKQKTEKRFVGKNIGNFEPADVQSYVEELLQAATVSKETDNWIIKYQDIKVQLSGADYTVQYGFTPNGPINRLFITGFVFSPNSSN